MENTKNVIDVITDEYDNLFPTEKKIATYIKNNPREVKCFRTGKKKWCQ